MAAVCIVSVMFLKEYKTLKEPSGQIIYMWVHLLRGKSSIYPKVEPRIYEQEWKLITKDSGVIVNRIFRFKKKADIILVVSEKTW